MNVLDDLVQPTLRVDYALVGGGLQNGLIVLAVRARHPGARIAVIERGARLGGNHTWCFHAGDIALADRAWVDPLVAHRWDGYDVAFPELARTLALPYAAVTSARFAEVVEQALDVPGSALLTDHDAIDVDEHDVIVRGPDGARRVQAEVVIDARGPDAAAAARGGFQKFVGLELRTTAPHALTTPILFDATVPQLDGLRFFYVLPLAPDRLLIEDTRFSDGPALDDDALRDACLAYAAARGWTVAEVVRQERGVLPMPTWLDPPLPTRGPLRAGVLGGWFHPATGYSFPVAVRLAALIAALPPAELFGPALLDLALRHHRQLAIAVRLNRMLFGWFAPEDRHHVLARFYRLPDATIRRFYALELGPRDVARIFVGRPPRGLRWMRMLSPEAR
jgi:lycopene beta-cyclase